VLVVLLVIVILLLLVILTIINKIDDRVTAITVHLAEERNKGLL
jgi:competence protein ComGC